MPPVYPNELVVSLRQHTYLIIKRHNTDVQIGLVDMLILLKNSSGCYFKYPVPVFTHIFNLCGRTEDTNK